MKIRSNIDKIYYSNSVAGKVLNSENRYLTWYGFTNCTSISDSY